MSHLLAHRSDPISSHRAAHEIVASGQQAALKARVCDAVARWPGSTADELAQAMGIDRYRVARRLSDAKNEGLIVRGEARKCTVALTDQCVWWPVEQQGTLL